MAFQYAKLINMQYILSGSELSGSKLYQHNTATYPTASYIREIIIYNGASSTTNASLFYVPSTGTVGSSSCFYFEPIPSGSTRMIEFTPPGLMLTGSDAIHGGASAPSKLTIMAFGGAE